MPTIIFMENNRRFSKNIEKPNIQLKEKKMSWKKNNKKYRRKPG